MSAAAACCLALLLSVGVASVKAGTLRFDGVAARVVSGQRRTTPRKVKRRMRGRSQEPGVEPGAWGGDHVRLRVSESGGVLEFDCAHGQIGVPFTTDADGRFDLQGTYTSEGPGPIRIGHLPTASPARYTGRVEGATMTLGVRLANSDESLGAYTLTRGVAGRVWKCR
ncbi:MAG: hypothetical protein QOJ70_1716 [Acidobacteriota bacterium]|jgi:hypothetical protein|nr:hypothetical protein [Acidobacteriota bacterium]